MKHLITLILLFSFCHYQHWSDTAILEWDAGIRKMTYCETGYFGNGCRKVYPMDKGQIALSLEPINKPKEKYIIKKLEQILIKGES